MKQDDSARVAVRATLAVMAKLSERTRTATDDILIQLLKANEPKLTDAVAELLQDKVQPPSSERIAAALAHVGIRV
jgi:uncharacterized protein (DUF2336 family)